MVEDLFDYCVMIRWSSTSTTREPLSNLGKESCSRKVMARVLFGPPV